MSSPVSPVTLAPDLQLMQWREEDLLDTVEPAVRATSKAAGSHRRVTMNGKLLAFLTQPMTVDPEEEANIKVVSNL